MSDKIHPRHLARKAILYVRQSSSYQVANNEESRRSQYAGEASANRLAEASPFISPSRFAEA